ncbi:hypothetical protein T492DRAFT_831659 [Pavlovales sp. CCMP2436]|nr:hypothetical protein T492DRAFT_831659 [Pavlovales sp. CCMP2436]
MAIAASSSKPYLSKYDSASASFPRDARHSPFSMSNTSEITIGGAGVPYIVINSQVPQQYLLVKQSVDTHTLIVYICVSSKITGQVMKVRLIEKAHVLRRHGSFCSIDDVQIFGRYMLKAYKWGMYSYRIVVVDRALPMPGTALPPDALAPTFHCWVGQNFDIIPAHIPVNIRQAVHTQIRQDLLAARARSTSILLVADKGVPDGNNGIAFSLRTPIKPKATAVSSLPKQAYLAVASAVFPMNYLPIMAVNDTLALATSLGTTTQYNGDSLAASLQTLINAKAPAVGAEVTYDATTLRLTFGASLASYTLLATSSCKRVLGMRGVTAIVPLGSALEMPGSIDLAGPRYLLVTAFTHARMLIRSLFEDDGIALVRGNTPRATSVFQRVHVNGYMSPLWENYGGGVAVSLGSAVTAFGGADSYIQAYVKSQSGNATSMANAINNDNKDFADIPDFSGEYAFANGVLNLHERTFTVYSEYTCLPSSCAKKYYDFDFDPDWSIRPAAALDAVDPVPTDYHMTFHYTQGCEPREAFNRPEGYVAVTLARSPVEWKLVVATARQMGTNGAHFGDVPDPGALGLQHCSLTHVTTGQELLCTVNSQTVESARWQHEFFSRSLKPLSDEQLMAHGEMKIKLYTSPANAEASFGQCVIVEEMWDLEASHVFHASHHAPSPSVTPEDFFHGHEEPKNSETDE